MRLPPTRWIGILVAAAAVTLAGYGLNRGILVGSRIETAKLSDAYPLPFFKKHCSYLFFSGVQQVWTESVSTKEEAAKSSCATLRSEPVLRRRRNPADL